MPRRPHEAPLTMTLPLVFLAAVTPSGRDPVRKFVSSDGMPYTTISTGVWRRGLCVAAAGIALATDVPARAAARRRPAGPAVPRPAQGSL